jgi:hypothetical protein
MFLSLLFLALCLISITSLKKFKTSSKGKTGCTTLSETTTTTNNFLIATKKVGAVYFSGYGEEVTLYLTPNGNPDVEFSYRIMIDSFNGYVSVYRSDFTIVCQLDSVTTYDEQLDYAIFVDPYDKKFIIDVGYTKSLICTDTNFKTFNYIGAYSSKNFNMCNFNIQFTDRKNQRALARAYTYI